MKLWSLNVQLIACLFSSIFFLNAQNLSISKKVKPAFQKYYGLPRASLFLHLNKDVFVKGEFLWFKGYLYNRLQAKPFDEPVNLYVGIYDKKGNQIKKKLFISKNGLSQGQIKIDSTLKEGTYFLKANTSWMRNFKEDDSFIQQFNVLGQSAKIESKSLDRAYDIQFLPEGGHWITNVQSVLGIKAINEAGQSIPFLKGVIRNQIGEEVANFSTNQFGLSKVTIEPVKGDLYWAHFVGPNGTTEKVSLPKAKEHGLTLSVKSIDQNKVMILVGTNEITKTKIGTKPFAILLHRDGLLKNLEVKFNKGEVYVSHILSKKEFHSGINIITLIDNLGQPIAERLFFNFEAITNDSVTTELSHTTKDSLSFKIFTSTKSLPTSLSVSVLPAETKAYQSDFSIKSSLLVKPYLKGFVENLRYYFEDQSSLKHAEFDLLLLTQGWSKYEWNNIYNHPPIKKYHFRTGVDVLAKVNKKIPKNSQLLLYGSDKANPQIVSINEETQGFKLDNYYVEEEEELQFTILDKRGRLTLPYLYLRTDNGSTMDNMYYLPSNRFELFKAPIYNSETISDFQISNDVIELDEVVVSDKSLPATVTTPMIPEYKLKKMTEHTERLFPNLIDLIRSNGFNVWEVPNQGYDRIRISTKRPMAFSLEQPAPILYVNDIRYSDLNILQDFRSSQIESYFIDRSGFGEAGGGGGVIRVYTRKEGDVGAASLKKTKKKDRFYLYRVSGGFTPVKSYYMPKYKNVTDESFKYFGSIHWVPNLVVDKTGQVKFSIPNIGVNNLVFFIEGMNEDGSLFSSKQEVGISSNE